MMRPWCRAVFGFDYWHAPRRYSFLLLGRRSWATRDGDNGETCWGRRNPPKNPATWFFSRWWQLKDFLLSPRILGENVSNLINIFLDGLKLPTRYTMNSWTRRTVFAQKGMMKWLKKEDRFEFMCWWWSTLMTWGCCTSWIFKSCW